MTGGPGPAPRRVLARTIFRSLPQAAQLCGIAWPGLFLLLCFLVVGETWGWWHIAPPPAASGTVVQLLGSATVLAILVLHVCWFRNHRILRYGAPIRAEVREASGDQVTYSVSIAGRTYRGHYLLPDGVQLATGDTLWLIHRTRPLRGLLVWPPSEPDRTAGGRGR